MAEVRLNHVYKRFGSTEVVKDANLEIRDGEFVVFVGPSGCGKTTILRMIAGLEEISEGEIYIGDRLINDVAPKDRDIAMVFQNYALYPHMTVYDNIACTLKWRNFPKKDIEPRVLAAAEMLELKPYLKRRPKELSGGQRQRVALARAMVREPKVSLMDEPLSNLDAKLRAQTRAELSRIHQRFRYTTIYVTHDQTEAMTMGDRIVVLSGGIIQQIGSPTELYMKPVNQFVAGFMGTPPMNFFRNTRITRGDAGMRVAIGEQSLSLPGEFASRVATVTNREVTIGLRPEDFIITTDGNGITGIVDVIENLGNEKLLYVKIGDQNALVRVAPSIGANIGDKLTLGANFDRLHVFDPDTTNALT